MLGNSKVSRIFMKPRTDVLEFEVCITFNYATEVSTSYETTNIYTISSLLRNHHAKLQSKAGKICNFFSYDF